MSSLVLKLKIRHKLFLAILIANCLLLGTIYVFGSWIFDTSFRDYLDQTEATRLTPLADVLANEYAEQGHWLWAGDRKDPTWRGLVSPYMSQRADRRRPPSGKGPERDPLGIDGNRDRPPPPGRRLSPGNHPFLLLDQNQRLVIGSPDALDKAYWIPIRQNAEVIGQLGFVRRLSITSDLDLLFAERIRSNFLWMILGILLISAIIAIPLSRLMVRPIEKLKLAMHSLASGHFDQSLTHKGNDEFAELVQSFNLLSATLDKNLTLRQQWVADISHELRTPVAVLQGELEAIQDGIRTLNKPAIDSLHQEVLRLSRLVNDLHELSLSDLGALSYQKTAVDIVDLVENVVEQNREALGSLSIDVSLQLPNDHELNNYHILGDFRRLEQLFTNLANNTRHYTQSPGSLEVSVQKRSGRISIVWADSAPGASDVDIAKLFDRLFRVESSRNRNTGGSGLGLAICQNIVTAHQGSIEATHSALGGISITITFPLLDY